MKPCIRAIRLRKYTRTSKKVYVSLLFAKEGVFCNMPQHITVVDYDPSWPDKFLSEAENVRGILKDNLIEIYHIGSTAVPGLAAKPVIDMMPVVRSLSLVDSLSYLFEEIGYEYMGEFGIPGRRYLRKGGDERTYQIHIFKEGNSVNINRHLAFRDYLISHEKEMREYAALKKRLALLFPYDIDGYCEGKDSFVKAIEAEALKESQ